MNKTDPILVAIKQNPVYLVKFQTYIDEKINAYKKVPAQGIRVLLFNSIYAFDVTEQWRTGGTWSVVDIWNRRKIKLDTIWPETNMKKLWQQEFEKRINILCIVLDMVIKDHPDNNRRKLYGIKTMERFSPELLKEKVTCRDYLDVILSKSLVSRMSDSLDFF